MSRMDDPPTSTDADAARPVRWTVSPNRESSDGRDSSAKQSQLSVVGDLADVGVISLTDQPVDVVGQQSTTGMSASAHSPRESSSDDDGFDTVEAMLAQFEQLERQLDEVREGLAHSHRLATLGTVATVIAHEFNNILTPVITYAQLAQSKDDAALTRKALDKAVAGATKAGRICQSLLGFAREADESHAADLPAVIDDTFACLARDPAKDNIDVEIDVPPVQVAIGGVNLQQVLMNLVLNAKQAMTGGTSRSGSNRLIIRASVGGGLVTLTVADTGPGIPADLGDRVFEPFVSRRGDTTNHTLDSPGESSGLSGDNLTNQILDNAVADSTQGDSSEPRGRRGTGLGLSICRDLIRAAGGRIDVANTPPPGSGAVFTIVLPVADPLFETT